MTWRRLVRCLTASLVVLALLGADCEPVDPQVEREARAACDPGDQLFDALRDEALHDLAPEWLLNPNPYLRPAGSRPYSEDGCQGPLAGVRGQILPPKGAAEGVRFYSRALEEKGWRRSSRLRAEFPCQPSVEDCRFIYSKSLAGSQAYARLLIHRYEEDDRWSSQLQVFVVPARERF